MGTITISKIEYQQLRKQATAYRNMVTKLHQFVLRDSVANVVKDFKATGLYSQAFLKDLESGLNKSSYSR